MASSALPTSLALLTASLALGACSGPEAPPPATFPVVDRTNVADGPAPVTTPPDAAAKAAAKVAVEVGAGIGPAVKAVGPLLDGIRASRDKHPPAARRLFQVDGWRFLGGWWLGKAPNGAELKAAVESATGETPGWDVTREASYGPDLQPTFPADVVRLRFDADQTLPGGTRLSFTLVAPLGARGQVLEASGTGSVVAPAPAGSTAIQALNARIGPDGTVERGDLALETRIEANFLLIAGSYGPAGLQSGAQLTFKGRPLGQLVAEGTGWAIKNDAGSFPI